MAPKSDGAFRFGCWTTARNSSPGDQTIYDDDRVKLESQAVDRAGGLVFQRQALFDVARVKGLNLGALFEFEHGVPVNWKLQ